MRDVAEKYDLAVAYRIYPRVAKPALGLPFSDDKYRLAEVCLKSFRRSLGTLRPKIWVLLDDCPVEYADLFHKYFEPHNLVMIPLPGLGNHQSFLRQIEILTEQDDAELVYFAEDDYFYRPDEFRLMIEFIHTYDDVDFVSPHDHPDYYRLQLHRKPNWLRLFRNHHWRTAASTCLTFLTTRDTLRKSQRIFRSYGKRNFDSSLWLSLTKQNVFSPLDFCRWAVGQPFLAKVLAKSWLFGTAQILFGKRYKLWVPVPGIATHLDASALSPATDWISLIRGEEHSVQTGVTHER